MGGNSMLSKGFRGLEPATLDRPGCRQGTVGQSSGQEGVTIHKAMIAVLCLRASWRLCHAVGCCPALEDLMGTNDGGHNGRHTRLQARHRWVNLCSDRGETSEGCCLQCCAQASCQLCVTTASKYTVGMRWNISRALMSAVTPIHRPGACSLRHWVLRFTIALVKLLTLPHIH